MHPAADVARDLCRSIRADASFKSRCAKNVQRLDTGPSRVPPPAGCSTDRLETPIVLNRQTQYDALGQYWLQIGSGRYTVTVIKSPVRKRCVLRKLWKEAPNMAPVKAAPNWTQNGGCLHLVSGVAGRWSHSKPLPKLNALLLELEILRNSASKRHHQNEKVVVHKIVTHSCNLI